MRLLTSFLVAASLSVATSLPAQGHQELRDSLSRASEILAYHPDSIDLRLKKAAWNIQLEQWNYAKDEYDYVLAKQPANIAGLYYRAYVNEKLNRFNFARLDYENLLLVVPGNFEAQLGLALLNEKDKHYTEAYDQINSLIDQYPDSAIAYAARAGMEKGRGMLELAEYDYTEALQRAPDEVDFLVNRADIRLTLGRREDAQNDLSRLLTLGVPRAALADFYKRLKALP